MPRTIYQIRFVLQQPSPIWKDFSLNNVKIHNQINPMKDVGFRLDRLQSMLSRRWRTCICSVRFSVNHLLSVYLPIPWSTMIKCQHWHLLWSDLLVSDSLIFIVVSFFFLQKIPSINELSQHLQGMWSICATMQQMEIGEDHIKRFDVSWGGEVEDHPSCTTMTKLFRFRLMDRMICKCCPILK